MAYRVKEIFYSLQGEGANAGTPAVFCRFSGCNLWSGREQDRADAVCRFCDTEFLGGDDYATAGQLAIAIRQRFPASSGAFVIFTGGEPTLQLDAPLIHELRILGCYLAIETNGTKLVPRGIDWITVSPKAGTDVVQRVGSELKVVVPQNDLDLHCMRGWDFRHFFVQPRDGHPDGIATAVSWAMTHPGWRVSMQTHKALAIR